MIQVFFLVLSCLAGNNIADDVLSADMCRRIEEVIDSRKIDNVIRKEVEASDDWLLVPSSNGGGISTMSVVVDGENILGVPQTIVRAEKSLDYYIPVDISRYRGKKISIVFTDVDDNDLTLSGIKQGSDRIPSREEKYRQIYHFTPDFGWTNDPNGMVYYDGEYHLAYQANPYGTKHFNMHWGNAVSTDLVHWQDLPFIVAPDSLGAIYSGSAVVDSGNSAGFGKDAIVAMYTSASMTQKQSIAYSTDRGRTYIKYTGNPVLDDEDKQPDFRDPKIIRYGDKWIVCVAAGEVIAFYGSDDLKHWNKLSEFGKGIGSHAAVWECPDLLKFSYNGKEKWVLIVNINPGGPNGGSVAQYFIGNFDGKEFIADNLPYPLWIDEGTDNYAGVTFSNTGDRHIFMGWMGNWLYANEVPTINFRNGMTLSRDLSLKHNGRHLFLASSPSPEVLSACEEARILDASSLPGIYTEENILDNNNGAYVLDFTVESVAHSLALTLRNSKGESLKYTFDFDNLSLNLDRSESGLTDFYDGFAKKDILTHLVKRDSYHVQLFMDRQSAEMFVGDGDLTFTNIMFPTEVYNGLEITSDCKVSDIKVLEVK